MSYSPTKVRISLTLLLCATFAGASADYLFGQVPSPPIRPIVAQVPPDTSVVINNRDALSTSGLAMLGTGIMTLVTLLINSYFGDRKSARENDSRFELLRVEAERKDLARQRELITYREEAAAMAAKTKQEAADLVAQAKKEAAELVAQAKADVAAREEELAQHRHDLRDHDSVVIGGLREHATANSEAINALLPVVHAAALTLPGVAVPQVEPIDPMLYRNAAKS